MKAEDIYEEFKKGKAPSRIEREFKLPMGSAREAVCDFWYADKMQAKKA